MTDQQIDENQHYEGDDLDADVVCQECELVNTPGTLICKQCGNNLRDQRSRRLAALAEGEATDQAAQRRQMLSGLLSVFGILAIVWVALNFNNIVEWMTAAQAATNDRAASLWRGEQGDVLDGMLDGLETNPPSQAVIDAAQTAPAAGPGFAGRYVLAQQNAIGTRVVGVAAVREVDSTVYYCALLNNGAEIRGVGSVETKTRASSPLGAIQSAGERTAGVGFAQRSEGAGTLTIIGLADGDDGQFRALAFRLPE